MNRRIGTFTLSDEWLSDLGEEGDFLLFQWLQFVPYRVEHHFLSNTFECVGASPHFDEVEEGEAAPEYGLIANISDEMEFEVVKL